MKNSLKKLGKLSLILMVISSFFSGLVLNVEATSVPKSFTATAEKTLDGYIAGYRFGKKKNSAGGYVYCNNIHKGTPHGEKMVLVGEAPAGIAYILENGYPNKNITGNSDYDYYITQAAVWWYLDDTTGSNNLSNSFKTTGSDPKGLRKYVKSLVSAAKKVKGYSTPSLSINNANKSMTLSKDKKYYVSDTISVNAKSVSGKYTVSLSGAPEGTKVVEATTLKEASSFTTNQGFKVMVPSAKVKDTKINITVNVKAAGSINKAYEYKSTDSSVQNVYGKALYPTNSELNDKTVLNLTTSKVSIIKIDSKTKVALAGATFSLYDNSGKKITSWTSTSKAHIIQNLPNGTYVLKEEKAPAGYKINKEDTKFTISDSKRDITLKVANTALTKLVNIVKIDKATGQPLAGAHLIVKNEKGETIADFVSTEEPYTIKDLADGKYSVYEEAAPNGYMKSEATYYFTISDGNTVASVTIENEKQGEKVEVPNTGDNSSVLPTALGVVTILSGIGFTYYNEKKNKQK